MRLQLFDTSVLIPVIRGEAYEDLFYRALRSGRARMSAVVMQELYAGSRSARDKRDLDGIRDVFQSRGYLATPGSDEWVEAGVLLARYQRLRGRVEPRDHISDVLIVLDAAKLGADLVTENGSDMERWRKMLRPSRRLLGIQVVRREDHRTE